jgi:hypothetical protein
VVFTLLVTTVSALPASFASAQGMFGPLPIESCVDYVARATSQVQMATGCNFQGPQWSADAKEHMQWCKDASPGDRGRQYSERTKALVGCRGDIGATAVRTCDEYASRVRSELDLAQALGSICSFKGARWSSNLVQHNNWCGRTTTREHESEDAERRKELAQCKAGSGRN